MIESEKTEKVIVVGPSGSGKDFLMRKLVEKGMKPALKWTTRPQRKFEKNGITYNFVNESTFVEAVENNEFAFYQTFEIIAEGTNDKETWYYGITNEEFRDCQVLIMTPGEIEQIQYKKDKTCVVYLDIDRETRKKRLSRRDDRNDSIERRLDADDEDFKKFKQSSIYDIRITDGDFESNDIYDLIF